MDVGALVDRCTTLLSIYGSRVMVAQGKNIAGTKKKKIYIKKNKSYSHSPLTSFEALCHRYLQRGAGGEKNGGARKRHAYGSRYSMAEIMNKEQGTV